MNPEHDYYIVCLNLIEREWERNRVGRVRELLESTKNNRYRGFEWGYWNRLSHREKRILGLSSGAPHTVQFSSDSRRLLTASFEGDTVIWGAQTGDTLLNLLNQKNLRDAVFSPEGKRLIVHDADGRPEAWGTD